MKEAARVSVEAEEIMGQYLMAFGAGAGAMRVRRDAVTVLRDRYLPCIEAALNENPQLWETDGSQVRYFVNVIGHFAATGRPDYPVYLNEFGFGTEDGELTQARYSARAAILLAQRPAIKLANFFLLGGDGWGYSYLNSAGTPRPVYPAMAHAFTMPRRTSSASASL